MEGTRAPAEMRHGAAMMVHTRVKTTGDAVHECGQRLECTELDIPEKEEKRSGVFS